MQLLAKFKKTLYIGFRATLNFRKSWNVLQTVLSHINCVVFTQPSRDTEKWFH